MLQPILHILNSERIILASASARRKQILEGIGLRVEVIPSTSPENLDKSKFHRPYEYALETAKLKTCEVADRLKNEQHKPSLIIGADTIVSCVNVIYEKPKDDEDAYQMLSKLSGVSHQVYTGVVLGKLEESGTLALSTFYEETAVRMAKLSPEIIWAYVATKEYQDKAGGYGIQGIGGTLIEGIQGDVYNVMGFPLHLFCKEVLKLYNASCCVGNLPFLTN